MKNYVFNLKSKHSYNESQIRIINQYISNTLGIKYRNNRDPEDREYEDFGDYLYDQLCMDYGLTIDQIVYSGTDYESPYDKECMERILNNYTQYTS